MSPGQREEYERLLAASIARQSPLDYALYVNKKAKRHRHTEFLNTVLLALTEGRLYKSGPGPAPRIVDISEEEPLGRRIHPETGEPTVDQLMISMPPRIGKSWMVGNHFPAWFLTTHPDDQIMYISHGADLAESLAASARDHIEEHPELGVQTNPEHRGRGEWSLAGRDAMTTGMIAKGSDGVPTGRGGHLIIDDIFKKGEDAMSDRNREKVHDHYNSSLRPRVNPGCWKILMGTRWHEHDLHGYLLDKEPEKWFVINIPAVSFDTVDIRDGVSIDPETKERDIFSRKPRQAICPEIAPLSYYDDAQATDPFWYEAEYLGKPSGVSGGLFKEFAHYKRHRTDDDRVIYEAFLGGDKSEFVDENDCVRFATVDLAASDKESADWYVMGIWDLDPSRRLFLREIVRERVSAGGDEEWLRTNYKKWNVRVMGIEQSTYDYKLVQDLIINALGINIWPLKPDKNKKVRAIPAAKLFKLKQVFVDRDAEWRSKYESELKKFDKDKHDDQVDVTSYAAVMRDLLATEQPPDAVKNNGLTGFDALMARLADQPPAKPDDSGMVIC